jgi:KDO2-lipid IV(A) lauroyltransferase
MNADNPVASTGGADRVDRHRLARMVLRHIPYSLGSPLFHLALGNPLTRGLLSKQLSALREVHAEVGKNPLDAASVDRYMQVNYTIFWRVHALMAASDATFKRYVKVENLEYLERYRDQRGVVLCNSHYGAGKIVPVLIARCGFDLGSLDRVNIFTQRDHVEGIGRIHSIELGKKGSDFHLKQLFQCKKLLDKNSILHIASDGYRGGSGYQHDFLGRQRVFRRSFAELAVATESVVVPIFSTLEGDGTIVARLLTPMDPLDIDGDKEKRITTLCDRYIELLEKHWRQSPESVFKNDLGIFTGLSRTA